MGLGGRSLDTLILTRERLQESVQCLTLGRFLSLPPKASNPAGLGWAREFAFLTSSKMRLVPLDRLTYLSRETHELGGSPCASGWRQAVTCPLCFPRCGGACEMRAAAEASWPRWSSWLGWQVGTAELAGTLPGIHPEWAGGARRRPRGRVAASRFCLRLFLLGPLHPTPSISCCAGLTPEGSFRCSRAHQSSSKGPCLGTFPSSLLLLKHPIPPPGYSPLPFLPGLRGRPDLGITSSLKPSWPCSFLGDNPTSPTVGRVRGPLPVRLPSPPDSPSSSWNFPRVSVGIDSRCPRPGSLDQIPRCRRWSVQTPGCLG